MKKTFIFLRNKFMSHKIIGSVLILIVLFTGYSIIKKASSASAETRYVVSSVIKGNLIVSVSGTGQVSASDQIDLKPKVSGDVLKVPVKVGQEVKKGDLIAQLDNTDAIKAVRDAQINLVNAQISLSQTKTSEAGAETDLKKAYDQAYSSVANSFLDFSDIMDGLKSSLFNTDIIAGQWNIDIYSDVIKPGSFAPNSDAYISYHKAKSLYEKNLIDYQSTDRNSSNDKITALIGETYDTSKSISEAVNATSNLIREYERKLLAQDKSVDPQVETYITNVNGYTSKINGNISDLFSNKKTIETNAGADPLNIQTKQLSLEQRQNALADAKSALNDYNIRAPFSGVLATLNVEKGDTASSATTVATIITKQKITTISLNEIDAAKVKVGQKTTLTFDAVDGLSIAGSVVEVDTLGTVSQGVVTYNIKIGMDTQDDKVKPGMSATASIITEMKQNVLMIPNSAIKSSGDVSYIELPGENVNLTASASGVVLKSPLKEQDVQIGIANDTFTEITSGLSEGDQIISRTITASSAKTQTAPSLFQTGGSSRNSGR